MPILKMFTSHQRTMAGLVSGFVLACAVFLLTTVIVSRWSVSQAYVNQPLIYTQDEESIFLQKILDGPVKPDDPTLVEYIRDKYIVEPATEDYNMKTTSNNTSMGQAQRVNIILSGMRNGFFVECGALDGETRSNTYFFERQLGWEGLLIEGDPKNFNILLEKNRKAYSINACLSSKNYPIKVQFLQQFNIGKIGSEDISKKKSGQAIVQCFPLYSILLALNRTRVDYFSLDVEGAELDVLRTIPFDKLDIRVMSVEYVHDPEGLDAVRNFVESKGYYVDSIVTNANYLANDFIFVKGKNPGSEIVQIKS